MMRLVSSVAVIVALSGCYYDVQKANQMEMPWGQRVEMACQGGKSMASDFVPAPRASRVRFDSTTVTLPHVCSAASCPGA